VRHLPLAQLPPPPAGHSGYSPPQANKKAKKMSTRVTRLLKTDISHRGFSQRSNLVKRLTNPHADPAKRRIRAYLLACSDLQLKSSLGLSDEDIRVLRGGKRRMSIVNRFDCS
jgi:hypothetical protein